MQLENVYNHFGLIALSLNFWQFENKFKLVEALAVYTRMFIIIAEKDLK